MQDIIVKVAVAIAPKFLGAAIDYKISNTQFNSLIDELEGIQKSDLIGFEVKVKFNNKLTNGFILEVIDSSEFSDKLKYIDSFASRISVLNSESINMFNEFSKYYGTNISKFLRFAIPKNSIRADLKYYNETKSFGLVNSELEEKSQTIPERLFIQAKLGIKNGIPNSILEATNRAIENAKSFKHTLVILPTISEVELFVKSVELSNSNGIVNLVNMSSMYTDSKQYQQFLRILKGDYNVIVGTRQASLIVESKIDEYIIINEHDARLKEIKEPYYNAREICLLRSELYNKSLTFISNSVSPTLARLIELKYFKHIFEPDRGSFPIIEIISNEDLIKRGEIVSKIPAIVVRTVKKALENGPVLFIAPRKGYIPLISCQICNEISICKNCNSPLRIDSDSKLKMLSCSNCLSKYTSFYCIHCNKNTQIKRVTIGASRFKEEIGKLFSGVKIIESSNSRSSEDGIIKTIEDTPQIVISTPFAEPIPQNGYQAIVILDANKLQHLNSLDGTTACVNRFFYWLSLVRSKQENGKLILLGGFDSKIKNSLITYNPLLFYKSELETRKNHKFPPYSRVAVLIAETSLIQKCNDILVNECEFESENIIGPFGIAETSYEQLLTNWLNKKNNNKQYDCILIRVQVNESRTLPKRLIEFETIAFKNKINDYLILIDPKELL